MIKKLLKNIIMLFVMFCIIAPISNAEIYATEDNVTDVASSTAVQNTTAQVAQAEAEPNFADIIAKYIWLIVVVISVAVACIAYFYIRITQKNQNRLRYLLEVDSFTGLMSRYKFENEVREKLKMAKPNQYFLLSLDIDNFKSINKVYGFDVGNNVLQEITRVIKLVSRPETLICKAEADNFITFAELTEKALEVYGNPVFYKEFTEQITKSCNIDSSLSLSCGICPVSDTSESLDYIMDCAKLARIKGKDMLGTTVIIFNEEMKQTQLKETKILTSMEQAINDEEFFIVIQPQISMVSGKLVGGEALVRWKRADGTLIFPDEFIPLFEKNHFIETLDKYVFDKACQFVYENDEIVPRISVNISGVTALSDSFIDDYLEILKRYNLNPEQFELELTESALNFDFDNIILVVARLKKCGFHLAIDDFGVGASSLARIKDLNVDVIKLDKAFLDLHTDEKKGRVVIENVISMANGLGFLTLAEGIETSESLDLLKELGCDLGQGYYFDKPLSTEEFLLCVIEDSKKEYSVTINTVEKIKGYLANFQNLPYGIAITKNDKFSTIIRANNVFYTIIGYTKQELWSLHENRLTDILLDNRYSVIATETNGEDYNIEFDLRLRTKNGNIVWIHDYVHYDAKQNLFFVTFTDITKQMISTDIELSFLAYQAKKESLTYLHKHISEYILISDMITDEVVYMNTNAMSYWGFKTEADWKGKKYHELCYNSTSSGEHNYQEPVFEEEFSSREYYNNLRDMYFHIKKKVIVVVGQKMRLSIISDVTAQKSEELSKINVLDKRTENFQNYENADKKIVEVLDMLRVHYGSSSVCFLMIDEDRTTYSATHQSIDSNFTPGGLLFKNRPISEVEKWITMFENEKNSIVDNRDELDTLSSERKVMEEYGISNMILAPFYDKNGILTGALSVNEPSLTNRSHTLVNVIAKDISDYLDKINISQMSTLDSSTGLLNKTATENEITAVLNRDGQGVMCIIDIDKFKKVNDTLGHCVGDIVLLDLSTELRKNFRNIDIIGRIGGDEFMVFCPSPISDEAVISRVQLILNSCDRTYEKDGVFASSSVSIGVCHATQNADTFQSLYEKTDKALYEAKRSGRNQMFIL